MASKKSGRDRGGHVQRPIPTPSVLSIDSRGSLSEYGEDSHPTHQHQSNAEEEQILAADMSLQLNIERGDGHVVVRGQSELRSNVVNSSKAVCVPESNHHRFNLIPMHPRQQHQESQYQQFQQLQSLYDQLQQENYLLKQRVQQFEERCRCSAVNPISKYFVSRSSGSCSTQDSTPEMTTSESSPLYALSPNSYFISPPMPIHSSTQINIIHEGQAGLLILSSNLETSASLQNTEVTEAEEDERENVSPMQRQEQGTINLDSSGDDATYYTTTASSMKSALDLHMTMNTLPRDDTIIWLKAPSDNEFILVRLQLLRYAKAEAVVAGGVENLKTPKSTAGRGRRHGGLRNVNRQNAAYEDKYNHFVARIIASTKDVHGRNPDYHQVYYYKKNPNRDVGIYFMQYENQKIYEVDNDQIVANLPKPKKTRRGEGVWFEFNFDNYKLG